MAEALPLGRAQLEFSSQAPGPAFSVMVQPWEMREKTHIGLCPWFLAPSS